MPIHADPSSAHHQMNAYRLDAAIRHSTVRSGPSRDRIARRVRRCLQADNRTFDAIVGGRASRQATEQNVGMSKVFNDLDFMTPTISKLPEHFTLA
jgi:hypothetical protein